MTDISIRESRPDEAAAILSLYPEIFPEEDLRPLVEGLLKRRESVLSLVALAGDKIIGHVIFTLCEVEGNPDQVALLGPLGVLPDWQGRGTGSALIRAGFNRMAEHSVPHICVLGDPDFYGRYGFMPENRIKPPYALPVEWEAAWQSFTPNGESATISGTFSPPEPWRNPSLWLP